MTKRCFWGWYIQSSSLRGAKLPPCFIPMPPSVPCVFSRLHCVRLTWQMLGFYKLLSPYTRWWSPYRFTKLLVEAIGSDDEFKVKLTWNLDFYIHKLTFSRFWSCILYQVVCNIHFKLWLGKWPVKTLRPTGFIIQGIKVVQLKVVKTDWIVNIT